MKTSESVVNQASIRHNRSHRSLLFRLLFYNNMNLNILAQIHQRALRSVLGNRYIMYGEWMYAKHTVYYNNLPHYFLEFDLFEREQGAFLDTPGQEELRRNRSRPESVPMAAIERMLGKLTLPTIREAHETEWFNR